MYLDNFCAGERLLPDSPGAQGDRCHQLAEAAWNNAGVLSSDKKRRRAVKVAEELGAELDGESKTLGASSSRLLRVIQLTIHLLGEAFSEEEGCTDLIGTLDFYFTILDDLVCVSLMKCGPSPQDK